MPPKLMGDLMCCGLLNFAAVYILKKPKVLLNLEEINFFLNVFVLIGNNPGLIIMSY